MAFIAAFSFLAGETRQALPRRLATLKSSLGGMIRDGQGVPPNADIAVGWLERAASHGYLPAYLPTARLYHSAARHPETKLLPAEFLAK